MKSLSILAIAAFASAVSAQNLLLPDNHHLGELATQAQASGSTNWWGTTAAGRRFQVLYEASHFTGKAGVAGPIDITHVKFRGEDTEKNTGGQTYSNVTVNVYKTTLTSATMSTTVFATNTAPVAPATTTLLKSATIPTVVVAPSLGTGPNNWMIDLDLSAALPLGVFDPLNDAASEFNLLVDITWTGYTAGPAIPPSTATIPIIATQDTTAHGAGIRGRGIYATTPTATSGTASTSPPVVGIEFAGGGGYASLIPATTEYIGASCGGSASGFYQLFVHNQPFDLANNGLTLTPDVPPPAAPNFYTVSLGAPPVDVTKVNAVANSTIDDAVLASTSMGFSTPFRFPGGSTSSIRPCTNGFVWMDVAMSASDSTPSLVEWLGNTAATPYTARFAPFWHDFDGGENTVTHPGSGLHVVAETVAPGANRCWVTWLNTGEFNTVAGGGQSVNTLQCVFHEATGVVEFRYGAMSLITDSSIGNFTNGIVGFTRGRIGSVNSVDPRSRDLLPEAIVPFTTGVELASSPHIFATSTPLAAAATYGARLFGGQSVTFGVSDVPPGTVLMMVNLDIVALQPGLQLPGVTAPGCMISTGIPPLIFGWESAFFPGATWNGTLPLVIPHVVWDGVTITAQAIELDISGGPNLVKWASDTMKFTVGLD
ncbi:MAG: hypothetical protein JNK78_12425 [Planctomycetes bacterium]|nr:hypothetical protein [Planctomycetota bacterium]